MFQRLTNPSHRVPSIREEEDRLVPLRKTEVMDRRELPNKKHLIERGFPEYKEI